MSRRLALSAVCVLVLASSPLARAQTTSSARRAIAVSLHYGVFEYDLSGTGDARMVAARIERALGRVGLLEGSLAVARPDQQFGDTTTYVIPEVQAQAQLPLGRIAPYLGAGIGLAMDFRKEIHGGTITDVTVSVAGGLRAWITERFGARTELRVRGIGTRFQGSAAEFTVGVALRL